MALTLARLPYSNLVTTPRFVVVSTNRSGSNPQGEVWTLIQTSSGWSTTAISLSIPDSSIQYFGQGIALQDPGNSDFSNVYLYVGDPSYNAGQGKVWIYLWNASTNQWVLNSTRQESNTLQYGQAISVTATPQNGPSLLTVLSQNTIWTYNLSNTGIQVPTVTGNFGVPGVYYPSTNATLSLSPSGTLNPILSVLETPNATSYNYGITVYEYNNSNAWTRLTTSPLTTDNYATSITQVLSLGVYGNYSVSGVDFQKNQILLYTVTSSGTVEQTGTIESPLSAAQLSTGTLTFVPPANFVTNISVNQLGTRIAGASGNTWYLLGSNVRPYGVTNTGGNVGQEYRVVKWETSPNLCMSLVGLSGACETLAVYDTYQGILQVSSNFQFANPTVVTLA